jgi:pyrroloquinoline quinone (PQQ) biosynthesis protein C
MYIIKKIYRVEDMCLYILESKYYLSRFAVTYSNYIERCTFEQTLVDLSP